MRGSEVILVKKGDKATAAVLNQGHYDKELWGLTIHPNSKSYYSAGEDKLLCRFDIKSKKLIQVSRGRCERNYAQSLLTPFLSRNKLSSKLRRYLGSLLMVSCSQLEVKTDS